MKHLHKFFNKYHTPWLSLVQEKYFLNDSLMLKTNKKLSQSKKIQKLNVLFKVFTHVSPGDGSTIILQKDLWNTQPLNILLIELFSLIRDQDITLMKFRMNIVPHNNFHLPLSEQAYMQLNQLFLFCHSMPDTSIVEDKWSYIWG